MTRGVVVFFSVPEEKQEQFYQFLREMVQQEEYEGLEANFLTMEGPVDYDLKKKGEENEV